MGNSVRRTRCSPWTPTSRAAGWSTRRRASSCAGKTEGGGPTVSDGANGQVDHVRRHCLITIDACRRRGAAHSRCAWSPLHPCARDVSGRETVERRPPAMRAGAPDVQLPPQRRVDGQQRAGHPPVDVAAEPTNGMRPTSRPDRVTRRPTRASSTAILPRPSCRRRRPGRRQPAAGRGCGRRWSGFV